jgi:hypothetical protein
MLTSLSLFANVDHNGTTDDASLVLDIMMNGTPDPSPVANTEGTSDPINGMSDANVLSPKMPVLRPLVVAVGHKRKTSKSLNIDKTRKKKTNKCAEISVT